MQQDEAEGGEEHENLVHSTRGQGTAAQAFALCRCGAIRTYIVGAVKNSRIITFLNIYTSVSMELAASHPCPTLLRPKHPADSK